MAKTSFKLRLLLLGVTVSTNAFGQSPPPAGDRISHVMQASSCEELELPPASQSSLKTIPGSCPGTLKDQNWPMQKSCDSFRDTESVKHTFYLYGASKGEDKVFTKICSDLKDGTLKPNGKLIKKRPVPMLTHYLNQTVCQQQQYPDTFVITDPLKLGPCPDNVPIAGKMQKISKKCESFPDSAGTIVTYFTYGYVLQTSGGPATLDDAGLATLCTNYKKSALEGSKGAKPSPLKKAIAPTKAN